MAELLISQDQIYSEVRKAIAEALQIPQEKVQPDSSLISDLAAESLDFIDINFRLEQRFFLASLGITLGVLVDAERLLFGPAHGLGGDLLAFGNPIEKNRSGGHRADGERDE